MSKQFNFVYQAPPIGLLAPAADAAGRTSSYKSLRNVSGKVAIVCRVNQGNAAQVTFTPLQAQDSSGTGSKVIPAVPVFFNLDTSLSDTLVAQANAANFQADAGLKDKFVVFEFDPAELDMANSFNHIAIQTSASNAANITEAFMEALGRYQGVAPPVSEV
jgi:hypothetical protein